MIRKPRNPQSHFARSKNPDKGYLENVARHAISKKSKKAKDFRIDDKDALAGWIELFKKNSKAKICIPKKIFFEFLDVFILRVIEDFVKENLKASESQNLAAEKNNIFGSTFGQTGEIEGDSNGEDPLGKNGCTLYAFDLENQEAEHFFALEENYVPIARSTVVSKETLYESLL